MRVSADLARAIYASVAGVGRVWGANGFLWVRGRRLVAKLRKLDEENDLLARYDVPSDVFLDVAGADKVEVLPEVARVVSADGTVARSAKCEPTRNVYKWEQYANPAVRQAVGYTCVDGDALAAACNLAMSACGGGRCIVTCEIIEERHDTVRVVAQNSEWKVEAIAFAE